MTQAPSSVRVTDKAAPVNSPRVRLVLPHCAEKRVASSPRTPSSLNFGAMLNPSFLRSRSRTRESTEPVSVLRSGSGAAASKVALGAGALTNGGSNEAKASSTSSGVDGTLAVAPSPPERSSTLTMPTSMRGKSHFFSSSMAMGTRKLTSSASSERKKVPTPPSSDTCCVRATSPVHASWEMTTLSAPIQFLTMVVRWAVNSLLPRWERSMNQ